jgi:ribosomal-protein-alanine N-acetyltransferase
VDELPRLSTARLLVRTPTASDAGRVAGYHVENRAHLTPWEPTRPEEYFTDAFWRAELARQERLARERTLLAFILIPRERPDGEILGRCSLTNIVRGPFQAAHLGFSLAKGATGRGFMLEALREVIRYAFEDLGLHRLMANHQPSNLRSARLLERLEFQEEGLARDYLLIAGEWRDHVLRSLVNERWRPERGLEA